MTVNKKLISILLSLFVALAFMPITEQASPVFGSHLLNTTMLPSAGAPIPEPKAIRSTGPIKSAGNTRR